MARGQAFRVRECELEAFFDAVDPVLFGSDRSGPFRTTRSRDKMLRLGASAKNGPCRADAFAMNGMGDLYALD